MTFDRDIRVEVQTRNTPLNLLSVWLLFDLGKKLTYIEHDLPSLYKTR